MGTSYLRINNLSRHIRLLVLMAFLSLSPCLLTKGQVIHYSVKPGLYTGITPLWEDMFVVEKGIDVGVIDGDGKIIVAPEASRVTGFYEGYALVLKSENGKERILGILSSNGDYSKLDGDYYTIPYQEFFSEGLLTVKNKSGKAGYMNPNGVVVKEFNVDLVAPFSEGYAAVGQNRDFTLVDKLFNKVSIQLGTVAEIYGGTNVYNGNAIIYDSNGKFYNFDVLRGKAKKISTPSSFDYDYLYTLRGVSGRPATVPYDKPRRMAVKLEAKSKGSKYGYESNGKVLLPYQLDEAENFYGNHAVVKKNGQPGILRYNSTTTDFGAFAKNSDIKYKKGSERNIPHNFEIRLPEYWAGKNITVKVRDEHRTVRTATSNGGIYEFTADAEAGSKKYDLELEAEGLTLWNGDILYSYTPQREPIQWPVNPTGSVTDKPQKMKADLSVSLEATRTHADKNDRCCVTATIRNPNSTPVNARVTWSGSELLEGNGKDVTVPANGSVKVDIYLKVLKAKSGIRVSVSTSAGGAATLNGLQLIPFN